MLNRLQDAFFRLVHGHRLIYNTCWEDPRADRELMQLDSQSKVVMITSAGCNALDYLLDDVAEIHSIDVNPRQNALLELKLALIKHTDFETLFALFGDGGHDNYRDMLARVRPHLSESSRDFWDRHAYYFNPRNRGGSFYYWGTSGYVAWTVRHFLKLFQPRLRAQLLRWVEAGSLAEQRELYAEIEPRFFSALVRFVIKQPAVMSLLGVPRAQVNLIRDQYPGGLSAFVRDRLRHMATEVPMRDNYFWRVYLTGRYTRECCPNYLREEHFEQLRARADRVSLHTTTFAEFLKSHPDRYSHFVLLDHQDWLAHHDRDGLAEEWRLILANSFRGARVLMRSAGLRIDFLPEFAVGCLRPFDDESAAWHARDRVGTYGSVLCAGLR